MVSRSILRATRTSIAPLSSSLNIRKPRSAPVRSIMASITWRSTSSRSSEELIVPEMVCNARSCSLSFSCDCTRSRNCSSESLSEASSSTTSRPSCGAANCACRAAWFNCVTRALSSLNKISTRSISNCVSEADNSFKGQSHSQRTGQRRQRCTSLRCRQR